MQSKKYLATALILVAIASAFYAGSAGFGFRQAMQPISTAMPTGQYTLQLQNEPIVVDHTAVDNFDKIPDYWIGEAKNLTVIHLGQSHGRQVPYGLMNIETDIDAKYNVNVIAGEATGNNNGALRILRSYLQPNGFWSGVASTDTDDYWEAALGTGGINVSNVRRTLDYYKASGVKIDAILHTWSWDFVTSYNPARINDYLTALETLEAEYPNITFIYMTDTQDRTGDQGYNVWRSHEHIRDYVRNNNKILFDYGELETWSADGTVQNTYYHAGSGLNIPSCYLLYWNCESGWGYTGPAGEGGSHINKAGTTMKGKAFWWLMARLAGWDGTTGGTCTDADGDGYDNCAIGQQGDDGKTIDCDDSDALEFPGQTWYKDNDNDNYSDGTTQTSCQRPTGYKTSSELTASSGDCNDSNQRIYPRNSNRYCDCDPSDGYATGTTESCTGGLDEDCDGLSNCNDPDCTASPACLTAFPQDFVSWWKFDDDLSDGTTSDETGRNNGSCSGTSCPAYLPAGGRNGSGAYRFDGINDYIDFGNEADFKVANKTISFWLNLGADTSDMKMVFGSGGANYYAAVRNRYFRVSWTNAAGSQKLWSSPANTLELIGTWAHYAIVFNVAGNAVNISVYKNGEIAYSTQNNEGHGSNFGTDFEIGRYASTGTIWFNGAIDDALFYNRALGAEEIAALAGQTGGSTCTDADGDGYDNCAIGQQGDDGKTIDCDDSDALEFPGQRWYKDSDNDGYSDGTTQTSCQRPIGYKASAELTASSGDCSDSNERIRPGNSNRYCDCDPSDGYATGTTESCTGGLDEDCDGLIDCGDSSCAMDAACITPPANSFYVAKNNPNCTDGGNGSESRPWCTIGKAAATLGAGQTVLVRGGVYHESVVPVNSGTADNKITYRAYPGEEVILDGSIEVTNWRPYTGSAYYAEIGSQYYPHAVFENDVPMLRAQHPNQAAADAFDPFNIGSYLHQENGGALWFIDNDLPNSFSYVGSKMHLYYYASVDDLSATVVGYDAAQKRVSIQGTYYDGTPLNFALDYPSSLRIEGYNFWGKLEFLDMPGEFFVDTTVNPNRIYAWAYDSQIPDNIKAVQFSEAFNLMNKNHIVIEGFTIKNYNNEGPRAVINSYSANEGIIIRNNRIYNNVGSAVHFRDGRNHIIENNLFYHNGIIGGAPSATFNTAGYGVLVTGGTNIIIRNNTIYGNIFDGIYATSLRDSVIRGNVIYDHDSKRTHHDCLKLETVMATDPITDNVTVEGNTIHRCGQTLFVAGIQNSNFYNNLIYDSDIYTLRFASRGSNNIKVIGNTLLGDDINRALLLDGPSSLNFVIKNNIIDGWCNRASELVSSIEYSHNLFVGRCWNQMALGQNDILSNSAEVFVDAVSGNYRLKQNSPAIDSGDNVAAYTTKDIEGTIRPQGRAFDIGAFEFSQTAECVDTPALLGYIGQWKQGSVTMLVLMQKIGAWKAGTGC